MSYNLAVCPVCGGNEIEREECVDCGMPVSRFVEPSPLGRFVVRPGKGIQFRIGVNGKIILSSEAARILAKGLLEAADLAEDKETLIARSLLESEEKNET